MTDWSATRNGIPMATEIVHAEAVVPDCCHVPMAYLQGGTDYETGEKLARWRCERCGSISDWRELVVDADWYDSGITAITES